MLLTPRVTSLSDDGDMSTSTFRLLATPRATWPLRVRPRMVDLDRSALDLSLVCCMPEHLAIQYQVVPLAVQGGTLLLAMSDPTNERAVDDACLITGYQVEPVAIGATGVPLHALRDGPRSLTIDPIATELPLESFDLEGWVCGPVAATQVRLRFCNAKDEPMEGALVVPLPARAVLREVVLDVAGRPLRGAVRRLWCEGDGPPPSSPSEHLVETLAEGGMAILVGELPPGAVVEAHLSWAEELPILAGLTEWRLPTAPPAAGPCLVSAVLHVDPLGVPAVRVEPPPGFVSSEQEGVVRLEGQWAALWDENLALRIRWPEGEGGQLGLADSQHFCLCLREVEPSALPTARALVLLLDVSGSVGAAPETVLCVLETLRDEDRFALVAFDLAIHLFENGDWCSKSRLLDARDWLRSLAAGGGSRLLPALAWFLGHGSGKRRKIGVLVTDGRLEHQSDLMRLLHLRGGSSPLHVVAIHPTPDPLLAELARVGRGSFHRAAPGEALEDVLDRAGRELLVPVAEGLQVQGNTLEPGSLVPQPPFDLLPSRSLHVWGRWTSPAPLELQDREGRSWVSVPSGTCPPQVQEALGALWARARLEALEESLLLPSDSSQHLRDQVVSLSEDYGAVSRYTTLSLEQDGGRSGPVRPFPLRVDGTYEGAGRLAVRRVLERTFPFATCCGDYPDVMGRGTGDLEFRPGRTREGELHPVARRVLDHACRVGATCVQVDSRRGTATATLFRGGSSQALLHIPESLQAPLLATLKSLAGLDPDLRGHLQRGRFTYLKDGRAVGMGVHAFPLTGGERVVVRVRPLDVRLSGDDLDDIAYVPAGLVLVVGAPESGRSVTLWSLLDQVAPEPTKVLLRSEGPVPPAWPALSLGLEEEACARALQASEFEVLALDPLDCPRHARAALDRALGGFWVLAVVPGPDVASALARFRDWGLGELASRALQLVVHCKRLPKPCARCGPVPDPVECDFCREDGLLFLREATRASSRARRGSRRKLG